MTDFLTIRDNLLKFSIRENDAQVTALFPTYVLLMETDLNRRLRVAKMANDVTISAIASKIALPTDFVELIKILTADGKVLAYVPPLEYDKYDKRSYTIIGTNIIVADAYITDTFDIIYYAKIPALLEATPNNSNWLTVDQFDMFLAGVLQQFYIWAEDDVNASKYTQIFESKAAALQESDTLAQRSGGKLRNRIGPNLHVV